MSDKTNFTDFDPSLLGEVEGLYLKEVTSINDGDTLAIIDSEGTVKQMGDLLPRPARNVTDAVINEAGELVFIMDEEGVEYNAGRFAITEEIEELFPEGLGVLTKSEVLKELVDNGRFKVIESDDSFEITLQPLEGTVTSNIINVEDPSKHQTFTISKTIDIDDYDRNSEIIVAGDRFTIAENVTIFKGHNTLKLIVSVTNSDSVDLVLKLAGTDTTYKHKSFILGMNKGVPRIKLELNVDAVDDVNVDISIRLPSTESQVINLPQDSLEATKQYEIATLAIVNKTIDASKIIPYIAPETDTLVDDVKAISDYIGRQPVDFKAVNLYNERQTGGYREIFEYNNKLIFIPNKSSLFLIKDLATNEVTSLNNPYHPTLILSSLKKDNLIYINVSNRTNIESLNLDTLEFAETEYKKHNSSPNLYWHYTEDRLYQLTNSGTIYDYELETGASISNQPITAEDGSQYIPQIVTNSYYTNAEKIQAAKKDSTYALSEFFTSYGKVKLESPGAVLYESEDEVGVLTYDEYTVNDVYVSYSKIPTQSSAIIGTTSATNYYGEQLFTKSSTMVFGRASAGWAEKPPWSTVQKTGKYGWSTTGFELSFDSFISSPGGVAFPTELNILGSDKVEEDTQDFKILSETTTTSTQDGRAFHMWSGGEHYASYPKNAWYSSTLMSSVTDMGREIEVHSLTTQSVYERSIGGYRDPDSLFLETSLDGVNWTQAEIIGDERPIDNENLGIVDLPELTDIDILGIRTVMEENSTTQIYGFCPLTSSDGKYVKPEFNIPDELAEGETPNSFKTKDGTQWFGTESVNANEQYSVRALFMLEHASRYFYPKNITDTPTIISAIFPAPKRITAISLNMNAATVDTFIEYTLNGTDWIRIKTVRVSKNQSKLNLLPLNAYAVKAFSENDYTVNACSLVTPVVARYLRIAVFNIDGSYAKVGRMYLNRATKKDWVNLATLNFSEESPPNLTETVTLAETFTGRSIRVEILSANVNDKNVYLNNVKILTDKPNRLIGNLIKLSDGTERPYEKVITFTDGDTEKYFMSQVTYTMRNRGMITVVDSAGDIVGFQTYTYEFSELRDGVLQPSNRISAERRSAKNYTYYKDGDFYYTAGDEGIFITDVTLQDVRDFEFNHKSLSKPLNNSSDQTTLMARDPSDVDSFFVFRKNCESIARMSPRTKELSFINLPSTTNTGGYQNRSLPQTSFADKERKIVFCPPYYETSMIRILPVGVEAKRRKFVNPKTGSVSYLAFADGVRFPESYMKMRYPIVPGINPGNPIIGFLSNYSGINHVTTFSNNVLDLFYLSYEFSEEIDFNGFEVYSGYLTNNGHQAPPETRIYTSDDGVNWTLLINVITSEHGIRSHGGWVERIDVPRTVTKFLKFEVDVEANKSGVWMYSFLPVIDQEMFTTTEFHRAVADEEIIGIDNYGFTSDNVSSKYTNTFELNENTIVATGASAGYPIIYDKVTGTYTSNGDYLKYEGVNLGIYSIFKDYKGRSVLSKSNGDCFVIHDDMTLTPYSSNIVTQPYNAVYGKDANMFFPSTYSSLLSITNLANGMNTETSYQSVSLARGDIAAVFAIGDYLIGFRKSTGGNDMISLYFTDTMEGETIEVGTDSFVNGLSAVKRLSNGDFFGAPYIEGLTRTQDFFVHFVNTDGITESDPDFEKIIELEG